MVAKPQANRARLIDFPQTAESVIARNPLTAAHFRSNASATERISNRIRLDELPEVLTAADVVAYLRGILGRNAVYELLHTQRIRNRRHGQKFLIPRTALREFVECRGEAPEAGAPR